MGPRTGGARALVIVLTSACLVENPNYDAGEQADVGSQDATGEMMGTSTIPNESSTSQPDTTDGGDPSGAESSPPMPGTGGGPEIFDLGSGGPSCPAFEPNPCPGGEACKPIRVDGDWIDTVCTSLVPEPAPQWGPCSFADRRLGGDDCDVGNVCYAGAGSGLAMCTPLCTGDASLPGCSVPGTQCELFGDGLFGLCLPGCDPLERSDCEKGLGCYWSEGPSLTCLPGRGAVGGLYDACGMITDCGPGMACVDGELVEGCDPFDACCVPHCDTARPSLCPVELDCVSIWFEGDPPPPPSLAHVGYCTSLI